MSTKTIIAAVGVFLATVIGISLLLTAGQKTPPRTDAYSASDKDRPVAEVPESLFNFGDIKVSDIKQKDFVLKNTGSKPLQILNINSSCNCTFGQLIYSDKETKKFGLHAQSGYVLDVAPNTEAIVRVTYQPQLMPIYGFVEREVYITTNDPQREKLIFAVKANVR